MNPKVLILGSSGFVGKALVAPLLQSGKVSVTGYSSSTLDLTARDWVERLCHVADQETILIVTARSRRGEDRFASFSEDIAIAANVAECLSKRRVKKCLYFSTLSAYGDAVTNLAITEETSLAPTSLYGIAKVAGESVLRQVAEECAIPLVVLRPCKIYGPGDTSRTYGPVRFIESILRERKVCVFGDGTELRDYLFIRDLVQITIRFALGDGCGTYNVATGQSHSFQEIIACLRRVTRQQFEVIHVARDRPKIDQRIDPSKLLGAMPGFRFTGLEEGLAETYAYFSAGLKGSATNG